MIIFRSTSDIASQRAEFAALLKKLGRASFDEIRAVLDERESVELEDGLSADVVARMKQKLSSSKLSITIPPVRE